MPWRTMAWHMPQCPNAAGSCCGFRAQHVPAEMPCCGGYAHVQLHACYICTHTCMLVTFVRLLVWNGVNALCSLHDNMCIFFYILVQVPSADWERGRNLQGSLSTVYDHCTVPFLLQFGKVASDMSRLHSMSWCYFYNFILTRTNFTITIKKLMKQPKICHTSGPRYAARA